MNKAIVGMFGVNLAGLFILLALHGAALLQAIGAIPGVIAQWSAPSAIGGWAVVAGIVLPLGVDLTLERWVPRCLNHHARRIAIELCVGGIAVLIVFGLLLPTVGGLLIALGCAMFTPLVSRGLRGLIRAHINNKDSP